MWIILTISSLLIIMFAGCLWFRDNTESKLKTRNTDNSWDVSSVISEDCDSSSDSDGGDGGC